METHDLFIFKQVAELQSITKAAEKLGYVQSNVSQRIKCLEEELGVKLFMRNNRGVVLTNEGMTLLDYTVQILSLMDEALSAVNPQKWKGALTLGASQTISAVKIPRIASAFLKENMDIDLKIKTNDQPTLHTMLLNGEMDGIFTTVPFNGKQFDSVFSYYQKAVMISSKKSSPEQMAGQRLIVNSDENCIYRNKLLDYYMEKDFGKPTIMQFDSLESILQAVQDGLGISMIPEDVANSRADIQKIPYKEPAEWIKIDFIIKQKKKHPPILKNFIRFLQSQDHNKESI